MGHQGAPRSGDFGRLRQRDPRWVELFLVERQAIRRAGRLDIAVEHVGSSAVEGLVGRPDIDLLIGVRRNADVPECARALQSLKYGVVSHSDSVHEPWAFLRRTGEVEFEVLIVRHLGYLWRRYVTLRDHLRSHPDNAAHYGRLKLEWAAEHGLDSPAYKDAKRRYWASFATN